MNWTPLRHSKSVSEDEICFKHRQDRCVCEKEGDHGRNGRKCLRVDIFFVWGEVVKMGRRRCLPPW